VVIKKITPCGVILDYAIFGRLAVVDIVINATMANFVGGFNDFFDIIGNFIYFAVRRINGFV
jgi:hypothetical protein